MQFCQKTLDILKQLITGSDQKQHCYHHLQKVWMGGILKAINTYLKGKLHDSLENISYHY